jgi:UDP-2,3-diacylglucosamine hydrolase
VKLELPALFRVDAPSGWQAIEFVSDLHLRAEQPRTIDAWSKYVDSTDADALFVLGDLFEAWIGDDARTEGFERRCADALHRSSARRATYFMAGNRDFLVGEALLADCGVIALPDPTLLDAWGRRVLLSHGDRLCLADHQYQRFRALVRSAEWQRDFLARPLVERRRLAREMRDASEQAKRAQSPQDWAEIDREAAIGWLREAGAGELVHGHTHRPGDESLGSGFARHVLSDWDADASPPRAEALRLTRAGFSRRPLAG